ncbi:MAG TPA: alpha/beta hydrolase [Candidatus Limnocylindrales bacterium]|nr:alpha/beta hydrolase [Candidatus Limnocylindrales bacterium]
MRHEFAEVNGVRLHYATEGAGKLVLFLHGFPEFWYEWKKQLAEFGRDFHAVAPDMRGYNLSSKPEGIEAYRVEHLLADVAALIQRLGHEKCVLVGHDWGGFVAWAFAGVFPRLVEKLVIVNAPHPAIFLRELAENPQQRQASQYMLMFRNVPGIEQMMAADNFANLDQVLLQPCIARGCFNEDDRRAYIEAWSQPGALKGGLNYYRAAELGPLEDGKAIPEPLASMVNNLVIRQPTLVIWGEQDPYLTIGNLRGLEALVPNLELCRVPDGTHWVIHEQPALVNSLMRDFIEEKPAKQRSA